VEAHKDVSLSEANAASHMCEHLLLTSRTQRELLARLAGCVAALNRTAYWLASAGSEASAAINAAAVSTVAVEQQLVGGASGAVTTVPSQQPARMAWLAAQKHVLDGLLLTVTDTCELLATCAAARVCDSSQQATALRSAELRCGSWRARLTTCKRALDAAAATVSLHPPTGPVVNWVSSAVCSVLADNTTAIAQLAQEAASAVSPNGGDLCVASGEVSGGLGDQIWMPPGVAMLATALCTAAKAAAAPNGAAAAAAIAEGTSEAGREEAVEAAVASVLLWSQGVVAASGACSGIMQWTASLESAAQPRLAEAIVSAAVTALLLSGSSGSCASASDSASALAPMLRLVCGALRLQAVRLLQLHRATTKLAYIASSIFSTLLEDGFCAPADGESKEAGGECVQMCITTTTASMRCFCAV
jgi:hypothetical protein